MNVDLSILAFISVNLFIFLAWHTTISVLRKLLVAESVVYAGLLAAAQIVSTELLLGSIGTLTLPVLLVLNMCASCALLGWVFLARRSLAFDRVADMGRQVIFAGNEILTPLNVVLIILGVFLTVWFCTAAYFLPPRGIDDLVAHLPPIYQYVQDQEISLLPIKLRDQFAMPQNGEFLFLWPLIFFRADTFIDLVQYVVAVYGIAVIFALARRLGVGRNDAAFAGLLFLFTPLVLGQAGSNYVDLTIGVCYLTLIYAVVAYWQTGALFHLIMAGIATGFGLGIKYNMLVAVVAVQPLIAVRLWRDHRLATAIRGYTTYLIFSLPLCIFWYGRNFLKTGYPLYPYQLDFHGLHAVGWSTSVNFPGNASLFSGLQPNKAITDFLHNPIGFSLSYLFQDPGLGSFHGGFGAVVLGLGIPALIYCFVIALRRLLQRDFFPVLFWGHVPLAFFVYFLQIQSVRFQFNQRLILVVIGFGLLAIAVAMKKLRNEVAGSVPVVRAYCVAASMLAVVHLAAYSWPSYALEEPVADAASETRTSDYKYFAQSPWELPLLRSAWEPLDFLTRDGGGWDVYTAAPWGLSWTTPVFGSRVQNRVWNFMHVDSPGKPENFPDAFIFHRMDDAELFYVGPKITPEDVWMDGGFEVVTQSATTLFWVDSKLLFDPEVRKRLITYYELTFSADIAALEPDIHKLLGGALITASPLGHGLKYLSMVGKLQMPVHIVPKGKEMQMARRLRAGRIVTIGKPLAGFSSKLMVQLASPAGPVSFYENRVR